VNVSSEATESLESYLARNELVASLLRDFCGLAAASERDSFEEKTLKEEEHNDDGKHDQT